MNAKQINYPAVGFLQLMAERRQQLVGKARKVLIFPKNQF